MKIKRRKKKNGKNNKKKPKNMEIVGKVMKMDLKKKSILEKKTSQPKNQALKIIMI